MENIINKTPRYPILCKAEHIANVRKANSSYIANADYISDLAKQAKKKNDESTIRVLIWRRYTLDQEYLNWIRESRPDYNPSPIVYRSADDLIQERPVETIDITLEKRNKIIARYEKKFTYLAAELDYEKSIYNDNGVLRVEAEIQRNRINLEKELASLDEWARKNPEKTVVTSDFRRLSKHQQEVSYVFDADSGDVNEYLAEQYKRTRKSQRGKFVESVGQVKNDDEILVKLRDVRIGFKIGNVERVVIDHMNLDIKRGEILGLVGESGSGKTTVGRAILRVNSVSQGVITYNNVPISGKIPAIRERALKTKIQMVFQDPAASLNERANVDYIISEGLRAFHLYKDEKDRLDKVHRILEEVGLRPEHLTRYPHEFSGGQRQRIGIARCMVMRPEFVIADEPISALDVSIRAQVLNLLKDFQKSNNMTILFIAHDLSVVRYISDRIAVIYDGKIVELCESNRMFRMPLHAYTKALLSAVPVPDPLIERKKKIKTYNPSIHGYTPNDDVQLREVEEGHFVRCNIAEYEKALRTIKKDAEGGK